MRRGAAMLAIGSLVAVTSFSAAFAYSVQPMIYTLVPGGSGANIRLSVANSREGQLNVELEAYSVTADDAGKRTFTPAPDDFLIFPPQASIAADRTQLFQVRYVGPAQMDKGRVYVVRVHQTNTIEALRPDPGATAQTHLNLSLNFNTTAIVQPRTLRPDLQIERDLGVGADGKLHARLVNRGAGVADLTKVVWSVARDGTAQPLPIEDIKYGDAVFVEPGHARDIVLADKIKVPGRLIAQLPGNGDGPGRM